ncbi:MAG: hypothetical protein OEW35_06355 [Gammaproteobacteria bacterium]|nr:hypothetical protein [Gammaproteobacteria bacterium]MDH4253396.1 hypothetical protein [Gammaproteobacteria bacterium]MDH5310293.1 hypothetical protein [Gammaproteobacteria bacterium]
MNRFIRVYLLPGAVMQSVMIGGAYATGREIAEFFTQYGMGGGTLGLAVAAVCIALVFALSLDVARRFQVFDYRRFARVLLGRAWFLYEIVAITLILLVVAVIAAASGRILADEFGLPVTLGGAAMLVGVVALVFFGRSWVTTILAFWSILLYVVFLSYLVSAFVWFDPTDAAREFVARDGWLLSGLQYAFYNVSAIPVVLYSAMAIETRREAITAGIVGALIAVLPALMLHLSFAVDYPGIVGSELPVYDLLARLDLGLLKFCYLLVIFGTFIETGAGSIQGIVERIEGALFEKRGTGLGRREHALIAAGIVLAAIALSLVGIIALVAEGYGAIAWGFLLFYITPLLTVGVYRLYLAPGSGQGAGP